MTRYFLSRLPPSDSVDGEGSYWRGAQWYKGWGDLGDTYEFVFESGKPTNSYVGFQVNLNLLAYARGDVLPEAGPNRTHVKPLSYRIRHGDPVTRGKADFTIWLRPFVQADDENGANATAFPIGQKLRAFLDDPLGIGGSLKLALPFSDSRVCVSHAWLRPSGAIHGAIDFSIPANPRPLHDVHAVADGKVVLLLNAEKDSGHQGGVVLSHRAGSGKEFLTLYQHINPNTIKLAVGDEVTAGTKLGTIRHWIEDGGPNSHNHFNLLVGSPSFTLNGTAVPALWYSIDPFGVYDYRDGSHYTPRALNGNESPIMGADGTIHWAGDPAILALPAELATDFVPIRQIQTRVRRAASSTSQQLVEHDQFLVWLQGIDEYFYAALGESLNRAIESELLRTLGRSYATSKRVRLGYRMEDGRRRIVAVWVRN